MKPLYVTSVEPFIGKTALCLGLGKRFQADGYKVGYIKPISIRPWRTPEGKLSDEDAAFVWSALGLDTDLADLTPIIITPASLRQRLKGIGGGDMLERIRGAVERAGKAKDVLLLEGGTSLREGYAIGLSNMSLAETLGAPVLVMAKYHAEMQVIDDILGSHARLGKQMFGAILNQIPDEARDFVDDYARPYLESVGIRVLGVLPSVPKLSALSVGELVRRLEAEVLTKNMDPESLAEAFMVGAMTLEACLSRFRRQQNKAVITGGDRTDIQLAALETSTVALILTGNLRPSPLVVQQAEAVNVPVLLVRMNTMETVKRIEDAYGKTRLGEPEKLEAFNQLMSEHVDMGAIYAALGMA